MALAVVSRLVEGPARPGELLDALGLDPKKSSGTLTRALAPLVEAGLLTKAPESNKNDPYELSRHAATEALLDAAANLAEQLSSLRLEVARAQAEVDAHHRPGRKGRATRDSG